MNTSLTLTREVMLDRRHACDPEYDGQYIVGVRTTGIYCLPSCRPPRLANPENVDFYASPEDARTAGLRPCKLCRPDDFYLGHDAGEALVEDLVGRIGLQPERYPNARSLLNDSGVGSSKLHELFRVHYHTTPSELLTRKRVAAARRLLLNSDLPVTEIAFEVGFESLSAFNSNFRKYSATTPARYRKIPDCPGFDLILPRQYPIDRMLAYLGRDPQSLTERVCGHIYRAALRTGSGAAIVQVAFQPGQAHCNIMSPEPLDVPEYASLHDRLLATLGLTVDPMRFEAQVSSSPDLAALIASQRGLRIPLVADPFDGLVWAIIGQQINVRFTCTLRRRLIERVSYPVDAGLYMPLTPEMVASLEPDDLLRLSFSRAKAEYLIDAARAVAGGQLPLEDMADASATRIERTLREVRGIGPWSAHYLMMRSYGFLDCVPVGDTALTMGLKQFFALEERPGKDETLALMDRFSPYRSLATFHLWQRFGRAA